jgi:putative transposase
VKTLRQHIRKLDKETFLELKEMCRNSNSLYNCCLYIIKNYYKETGKYIGQNQLYKEIKNNKHFKYLPAKISQQIVRLVDKNYRSFFALLKKKHNGMYGDKVNEPRYKKPNSLFNLILPNDQINLIKGKLKITKNIRIPFSYKIDGEIKQCVIKPNNNGKYFMIYLTYEENKKEENDELNDNNYLSIDLGLDNLIACYSNVGHSFIVNGKPLKSYNQYYNKRISKIKSKLEKFNKKKWSNKLSRLSINRENYIHNYINQTISVIIKYCIKHKIKNVIIGYNETWKQEINIGKVNNQKFCNIPHYKLKEKLGYKCYENGINFTMTEESYTSKCSFIDNEELKKHDNYIGRRIKRGLFKTKNGLLINADINGACNILRKVVPEFKYDGIVGKIVCPSMLNIFNLKSNFVEVS